MLYNICAIKYINTMIADTIGVVMDAGSQNTTAGFAGEPSPRVMIPSTVGRYRQQALLDGIPPYFCGKDAIKNRGISQLIWPVQEGMITDWDEMEKLWHHVFYRELHVPPENSRIMYAVHPLVPRENMERISEILFESFAIHGLYMAKSPALVLCASGRTSGVVWEDGYACSYAAPVFEGFPLKHSTVKFPITGKVLTDYMQKLMFKLGYSFTTPAEFDIMEQIKKDLCYVAQDYETELANTAGYSDCKVRYDLPDGQHIMLGEERFQIAEALLQPALAGYDCKNMVDSIMASIDLCDLDYRKIFIKNIVFAGGSSLFPGLVERVYQDLSHDLRLGIRPYIDVMATRQYAAWAGGSMMASLTGLHGFWLTKQEYEDAGPDSVKYKFFS